MTEIARVRSVTVRLEGDRILVLDRGTAIIDLPWNAALELAHAIRQQAKRAEEIICREQVIRDQAIIQRLGLPFGLTNHPVLQAEAMKEAAWNSELRRAIPGGIRSQEIVGTPTLIQHAKRKAQSA